MKAVGRIAGSQGLEKRLVQGARQRLKQEFRLAPLASAMALTLAAGSYAGVAHSAGAFSSAWFAAKGAAQSQTRANGVPASSLIPTGSQQSLAAQQKLAQSMNNLQRVAAGIAAQQAAQNAARTAALAAPSGVPDGLAAGGLSVDSDNAWVNANLPTQGVDANGHVTVTVAQTSARAIANWSNFNVGKNTTLHFDQSAGTQTNGANNWAILNRVNDPSGKPSQILGQMAAEGSVYVINRNGIIFGGGSQVNVHALVASSLDFLKTDTNLVQTAADVAASNALFLGQVPGQAGGLAQLAAGSSTTTNNNFGTPAEVLGMGYTVNVTSATDYAVPGDVTIVPGAQITTKPTGSVSDGGFVLVAAPHVNNGGTILSPGGQIVLAAGVGVSLKANSANPQILVPELTGQLLIPIDSLHSTDVTPAGTFVNTGIISADRGNVNLLGSSLTQNGLVQATTSVNVPGGITFSTVDEYYANTPTGTGYGGTPALDGGISGGPVYLTHRAGTLVFGPNSVTTILPDGDGQTATSAPGVTFAVGSINATAGAIWFQNGSLIDAPGATVSFAALTPSVAGNTMAAGDLSEPGRILVDAGATIDVAGLANVVLAASSSLVTIDRIGQNELADSPLQRNSFLLGLKGVVVDSTSTGVRDDGTPWVGSPVLNAQGYVDLIPRSIDQLMTQGGTITLAGNEVMTAAGSSLNVSGGYTHYMAGEVSTTRVVDQYGRIVPIGQVDPDVGVIGIAGQYAYVHHRWGVTDTWTNPLLTRPVYQDEYIVGDDAGTINVVGSTAVVLNGAMSAQVVAGSKQVQNASAPLGGTFTLGKNVRLTQGTVSSAPDTGQNGLIILQDHGPDLSGLGTDFSIGTALNTAALKALDDSDPANVLATVVVPTDTLASGGFASLAITGNATGYAGVLVPEGQSLRLQPGGTVTIIGAGRGSDPSSSGGLTVLGSIEIPSGTFSFTGGGDIVVGPRGVIDVAGQWVNNDGRIVVDSAPGGSQFIDGGNIVLRTDGTKLDLQGGSLLDVSSGGEIQADGQLLMAGGAPRGKGGSVSLLTDATPMTWGTSFLVNGVTLDGTIRSYGFEGGGTLSIRTSAIQVGGTTPTGPDGATPFAAEADSAALLLPQDFFARQGFGNYALSALYDVSVAPGADVRLTQENLIANVPALLQAGSGADLWQGGMTTVGTVDPYYRQATGLTMVGGNFLYAAPNLSQLGATVPPVPAFYDGVGAVTIGHGAAIVADAGASIGLGSPVQTTILGKVVAHGGTITLSADVGGGSGYLPYLISGQYASGDSRALTGRSVWLGSDAVLDVSGVALDAPYPHAVRSRSTVFLPNAGKVLAGGAVNLSADQGYIVTQAGSVIDASGTAATFDQLQSDGTYASQAVWSDAGSIAVAAGQGLYLNGTLQARPGAVQGQGGTLIVQPQPLATALVIEQKGQSVPDGLAPGQSFTASAGPVTGVLRFGVDSLAGSGITTLMLGGSDDASNLDAGLTPIAFHGDVDIDMGRAVVLRAGTIAAISDSQLARILPSVGTDGHWLAPAQASLTAMLAAQAGSQDVTALPAVGTSVLIAAPYVEIVGPVPRNPTQLLAPLRALADGVFSVNASFIDVVNQVQLNNFGETTFTSSGDIRLTTTIPSFAIGSPNAFTAGTLYTPGNLTLAAADVYPSTGTTFILDAVGPLDGAGTPVPTTIAFRSTGSSSTPLSGGGTLMVDATDIVQGGTVRAPSGTLIFGVGDASDPATQTLFNSLPLVDTRSVTVAAGSVTSVSNGGLIIPYGVTVDGTEWQYNAVPNRNPAPDLTSAPAKYIGVNGASVALAPGANIDLSGGGDLQATEWVAGTGGTRDVLSRYSISYAKSEAGIATALLPGAANIYAILPGVQSPVAAYDPMMAQTTVPTVLGNGSAGSTTASIAVGQAALSGAVGQAVFLQGVAGLPDGVYTLLPAKYATVPGAYRVTVNSTAKAMPGAHTAAPDGTQMVTGYFADALSGARSATPVLFNVQSEATWQQYSQYTATSANTFFASQAASNGTVTPALSRDAGQLVLAASQALTLGAKLNTSAADGGAPAQVDIASQDIQILGQGATTLPGYLQISASDLDALGAGSLLIGGKRSLTSDGVSILPIANSVVVSNDANSALTGPEIVLVTKTAGAPASSAGSGSPIADPNAANGLRIDGGSVISALGAYPGAKDVPIFIGQAPADDGTGGVSGDGALLMVSNGAPVTVKRANTTAAADNAGLLTVAAGASLAGGQSLVLDSSGNVSFDPAASLSGNTIAVDGARITFTDKTGADAADIPGFVVGANQISQLAQADTVVLRSYGSMVFDGNIDARFGNNVDLGAGVFETTGGAVVIGAPKVAFSNEAGAPVSTALTAGTGTLVVNASEIDLGAGSTSASGFNAVTFNATSGIVGLNTGSFDFGPAALTLNAPVYLADTGSDATVKTTGALTINPAAGTAVSRPTAGGALTFIGGAIVDNAATILAPAGNVTMEATSGDLDIVDGSLISSAGVAKAFFDIVAYAPAGKISLTSDKGSVNVASKAVLDFSGAQGGGDAGALVLSAPVQTVNLAGTIKGGAAPGYTGGSLSLNTGGAIDLDGLAAIMAASGVNNAISIRTGMGNLTLSGGHAIVARNVSLTADGGSGGSDGSNGKITILGTIDATGTAGGEIDLYGKSGVELDGSLIARACLTGVACGDEGLNPNQRGGTINIGTTAVGDPGAINSTYGYENIASGSSGWIVLGPNSLIDVSGGSAGGLSGGTVNFRAPLVDTATGAGSVNVRADAGARIAGSRATAVEAYAIWSTGDQSTGSQHFDGIVDAAGWYDAQGHLLAGTFTSQDGTSTFAFTPDGTGGGTLAKGAVRTAVTADQLRNGDPAIGFGGLTALSFAPTTANANHQAFYAYADSAAAAPGTLMRFIQSGVQGAADALAATPFASFANFAVRPGVELVNTNPATNNGNISVLTNWNLGAGTSVNNLAYRFHDQAPVITFRAANNVNVDASLTDGFFQISNPTGSGKSIDIPRGSPTDTLASATASWNHPYTRQGNFSSTPSAYARFYSWLTPPANFTLTPENAEEVEQYYATYKVWLQYLFSSTQSPNPSAQNQDYIVGGLNNTNRIAGQPVFTATAPTAADMQANPSAWYEYFAQYQLYLGQLIPFEKTHPVLNFQTWVLLPPPAVLVSITDTSVVVTPAATDNTPSPLAVAGNSAPVLSASPAGGESSSYRIVAGADAGSANPLAVQAAALFGSERSDQGSVTLNGHTSFVDANGRTVVAPTVLRTGTGSISIAAGNGVALLDTIAPGAIYTGGQSADGTTLGTQATIVKGDPQQGLPDILVTGAVNPDSAGDISIQAQGDITGVELLYDDALGSITGVANTDRSQFWWQWMQVSPTPIASNGAILASQNRSSINFGAFDQGIMSVGGNVSIRADGNITNLGVSLPTSWYRNADGTSVTTVGGGNLSVTSGKDILSGTYFVAKGSGTITAGGRIASDLRYRNIPGGKTGTGSLATLLALQDATLNVNARQGAQIGGIYDPSYIQGQQLLNTYKSYADMQSYSVTSAVNVATTTGDLTFGTSTSLDGLVGGSPIVTTGLADLSTILPATLGLTALNGEISVLNGGTLFPSSTGNLSLIADGTIQLYESRGVLGMSDQDPSSMPTPEHRNVAVYSIVPPVGASTGSASAAHAVTPLHADDTEPARIYSLAGSIIDGRMQGISDANPGFYDQVMNIVLDKPAFIQAGQDIVNLAFVGQNLRQSDVTRVIAGGDIYDTALPPINVDPVPPRLVLAGPGTFDIEAGGSIGPLTNEAQLFQSAKQNLVSAGTPGIMAVGNAFNPNLPHESANISVLFGVGPGVNLAPFIAQYIDPAALGVGDITPDTGALVAFMKRYDAGRGVDTGLVKDQDAAQAAVATLTPAQAWSEFQQLPSYVQQQFAQQTLFSILTRVGQDYNDVSSPDYGKYARGYQAINTLFPASLGYTANNLEGGDNGAQRLASTGNLDIRSTTIQTQQGGNIDILGPGGQALVGSTSAPPAIVLNGQVLAGPGTQGILTLEQGDINIFTDRSLLLAQSRVFTEQGGAMTIWSSNGDINAGKGSKSAADVPAPQYVCDFNHFCTIDARGAVTGAGIATLQTIPGAPASDANLIAPRGTVDAGDAGIRVSGNLNVAALHVANADNIQVQGKSAGVPVVAAVNVSALTSASAAASAAADAAADVTRQQQATARQALPSIITVQVLGFGNEPSGGFGAGLPSDDRQKSSSPRVDNGGIDTNSPLQFLGAGGSVDPRQLAQLTPDERQRVLANR